MKSSRNVPSIDRLNEVFRYEPETGLLYWNKKCANKVRVGKQAGTVHTCGSCKSHTFKKMYLHLSLDKVFLSVHRIVWAMTYGSWPDTIDHIDGNGLNNRLENLRNVTMRENCRNTKRPHNNTSGFTGVIWLKDKLMWRANIKVNQRNLYLGSFVDKQDAVDARKRAEVQYGFHPNHGSDRPHYGAEQCLIASGS